MILRKRWALLLIALPVIGAQCSRQTTAKYEENNLGVVRFPNPWTRTAADGSVVVFTSTKGFMVRQSTQEKELIFAKTGSLPLGEAESVYSDRFYAVSMDHHFSVRAATKDEWERASELSNTRRQIHSNKFGLSTEPGKHLEEGVSYQGKVFNKSGKFWGNTVGLLSPHGRWLAVFSFSSSAKPATSWSPLDGGTPNEPRPGEMFVDVYETSSGQRILNGRTRYDNSPSILFEDSFWAGENYLVVPLDNAERSDNGGQACFLGILPTQ